MVLYRLETFPDGEFRFIPIPKAAAVAAASTPRVTTDDTSGGLFSAKVPTLAQEIKAEADRGRDGTAYMGGQVDEQPPARPAPVAPANAPAQYLGSELVDEQPTEPLVTLEQKTTQYLGDALVDAPAPAQAVEESVAPAVPVVPAEAVEPDLPAAASDPAAPAVPVAPIDPAEPTAPNTEGF